MRDAVKTRGGPWKRHRQRQIEHVGSRALLNHSGIKSTVSIFFPAPLIALVRCGEVGVSCNRRMQLGHSST